MKAFTSLITLAFLALAVHAQEQTWPHLRTTWKPIGGFDVQPRTEAELLEAGWTLELACGDSETFTGNRWIDPQMDLVIITDINGFIAGAGSLIPAVLLDPQQALNPYYQIDRLANGQEFYALTAYFVDPATICTTGRTQAEFDVEGTGNMLAFQNGPTPADLEIIPLEDTGLTETHWNKHNCFLNMGRHWFTLNYDPNESCDAITPFQLVYHNGKLNGFVFQSVTSYTTARYEEVTVAAIDAIVDTAPTCLYDLVETPGQQTMHVYLSDYNVFC